MIDLPSTTRASEVEQLLANYHLFPYEICINSIRVPQNHLVLSHRVACVHFSSLAEKNFAMEHLNGTKWRGNKLSMTSCACTRSFETENELHNASGARLYENNRPVSSKQTDLRRNVRLNSENTDAMQVIPLPLDRHHPNSSKETAPIVTSCEIVNKDWCKCRESELAWLKAPTKKSRPPRNERRGAVVHGTKVSNLGPHTTESQVREHFESRNFEVVHVEVYSNNEDQFLACVHFPDECSKRDAIEKVNGSKLYGRRLTIESCCCTQSGARVKQQISSERVSLTPDSSVLYQKHRRTNVQSMNGRIWASPDTNVNSRNSRSFRLGNRSNSSANATISESYHRLTHDHTGSTSVSTLAEKIVGAQKFLGQLFRRRNKLRPHRKYR